MAFLSGKPISTVKPLKKPKTEAKMVKAAEKRGQGGRKLTSYFKTV
jgi:hypothetical protein